MRMRRKGWRICSGVRSWMGKGGVWKGEVGMHLTRYAGKDV
jgi:hypothetical protein